LIKTFPVLKLLELAVRAGINPVSIPHYTCNVKNFSEKLKKEIEKVSHQLGKEWQSVSL